MGLLQSKRVPELALAHSVEEADPAVACSPSVSGAGAPQSLQPQSLPSWASNIEVLCLHTTP